MTTMEIRVGLAGAGMIVGGLAIILFPHSGPDWFAFAAYVSGVLMGGSFFFRDS